MKNVLKWIGLVVVGLILIVAVTAIYYINNFEYRIGRTFDITPQEFSIPDDSLALAEGKRLVNIHCTMCHGNDLGGTEFFNDPMMGSIPASNLTPGEGGIGSQYSSIDFVRAIRHGVKKDGKAAFVMPSKEFQHLSDRDLGYIVAYLQTLRPVDKRWGGPHLTLLARALAGMGMFGDVLNAENINHQALVSVRAPRAAVTTNYGKYLVRISGCQSCHGEQLNGKQPGEPGAPFAPNITPGGALGKWSRDQFISTIRTGTTPENRKLNPKYMPYEGFKHMTDEELSAIYLFLGGQPTLASAE